MEIAGSRKKEEERNTSPVKIVCVFLFSEKFWVAGFLGGFVLGGGFVGEEVLGLDVGCVWGGGELVGE